MYPYVHCGSCAAHGCASVARGRMPEATAPCALHSGRSRRFQEVPSSLVSRFCRRPGKLFGRQLVVDQAAGDQDRKSVVSGKSVSIRLALGSRRIIKKNKLMTERKPLVIQ